MNGAKFRQNIKKRDSDIIFKDFPLEIVHINKPANNMNFFHWHDFMELSHIESGQGTYEIEGKVFDVSEGDIVIINNIEHHRVTYSADNSLYETVMHFAPSLIWTKENSYFDHSYLELFLYKGARFKNRPTLTPKTRGAISTLMKEIVEEYTNKPHFFELMIKSKLLTLITHLIRVCEIDFIDCDEYLHRKKNIQRVEEILQYIKTNYAEDLDLNSLAEKFHMNSAYFSDFFKRNVGTNFSEYLMQTRINEAVRLLNENCLNSTEIAFAVGFNNMPSFYQAFKRVTGQNPRQYRSHKEAVKSS